MDEPNPNDNQNQVLCCQPLVEENDVIKKIRPILNAGLIIYIILLFVDLFYLNTGSLFTYIFLSMALYLLSYNKCFLIFHMYTLVSILLVFGTIIPYIGIIIQIKFGSSSHTIIKFCIFVFIVIFSFFIFYFSFVGYREMRYLFIQRRGRPQFVPNYTAPNISNNANYNSNNSNNNTNNKGGFKAFSGKGYRVG